MPHRAIIGQTGSGKTVCGKQTAAESLRSGRGVLVLHKPREPWPYSGPLFWQTDSPEQFLAVFWAARSCDAFMELADADVDKFDARFHRCFTQGRHEGHRCFYLSQRAAQVHPNIRENCESLCLFSCSQKAAKLWAEEFNDDALVSAVIPPEIVGGRTDARGAMNLPPGWFFFKSSRYTPARLLRLNLTA